MAVLIPCFPADWRWPRWVLASLLALLLSSCLESAAPDLVPRQPSLLLDLPVGDSTVNLNYTPISLAGSARTYAGFRSLRVYVSRNGGPEVLAQNLTPQEGVRTANISSSILSNGAQRAAVRVELIDAFGYRLERTLRARLIGGLPLTLSFDASAPPRPAGLARGASAALPLHVLSSGALRELQIYEQVGQSAPRLLRTVAGSEFTHPNNVPILWNLPYTYAAPTDVRPRQDVTVRFDLRAVSGLTTSLSFTYQLLP